MSIHHACWHRAILRTRHLLTGASIIGGLIWAAAEVGRQAVAFLTAIGAASPAVWPAGTSAVIVRGDLFLTRVLAGGAMLALSFGALYAAVRLCLSVGALVFELIGAVRVRPRIGARDWRI